MNSTPATARPAWRSSRYGFAIFFGLSLVSLWLLLRFVLFFSFKPDGPVAIGELLSIFTTGLHRDIYVALALVSPLLFWFMILPNRRFVQRWQRGLLRGWFFLFWLAEVFLIAAEYYFFEEFHSRFNTVAVDYLIYPHEVFINIWDSYPVPVVVAVCALLSGSWVVIAFRLFKQAWTQPCPLRVRIAWWFGGLVAFALLTPTVHIKGARVSADRTLNEIANNGGISFWAAFWTRHLDYAAFYKTLPREEACARARRMLAEPNAEFIGGPDSILRHVGGDSNRPRLNVVLILVESFGSEFSGALSRTNGTLTPEMDRLAAEEGLLFTHIYASGNRTVRGMEGALSGFPPLPGDSIVKRDLSENVETIARVLKRDGYDTVFLYGGRGVFDGMRAYAVNNGYDRFIEQKHFEKPTFKTIWGVCDEDLMARSIEEFREMHRTGRPFFGTVLTVSNHKPYTYPKGRIPENPDEQRREFAVKYTDFALGEFFRAARQEAFWTNTIFVVMADHGARVYGSQSIPIFSYEIPLTIAGPAVVERPARIASLGCSLDVSPTILGLIGRPYDSLFFGRDLLNGPPEDGRVFLNHNREIGMYARERLIVLRLFKNVEVYEGDPKVVNLELMKSPGEFESELEKDAEAIYQVADELYVGRKYRLDPEGAKATQR